MERIPITPRPNYQEKIELLGFDFHASYWKEEAYYHLRTDEVDKLEKATLDTIESGEMTKDLAGMFSLEGVTVKALDSREFLEAIAARL